MFYNIYTIKKKINIKIYGANLLPQVQNKKIIMVENIFINVFHRIRIIMLANILKSKFATSKIQGEK